MIRSRFPRGARLRPSALALLMAFAFSPQFAHAEEAGEPKSATPEVKAATTVHDATAAADAIRAKVVEKAAPIKDAAKKPKTAAATEKSFGDISIEHFENTNHGIQAIFINSDVVIEGGTIHSEINNEEEIEAAGEGGEGEERDGPPAGGRRPSPKPDEKPGPFEALIKDATKEEGLFTVYTLKDKVLWEIPDERMEQTYLLKAVMATGVGASMAKPGALVDGTEDPNSLNSGTLVRFEKMDDKIRLVQPNHRFRVPEGSPEQRGIEKNYSESIVATFPVPATNPENGASLIEIDKFLLADYFQTANVVRASMGVGYGIDRENSYIKESKVMPENIVTRARYEFRSGQMTGNIAAPDTRSVGTDVLYHILPLRDNPDYKPRIADLRVGHWVEAGINFGNDEQRSAFERRIARWDVRKASPEEAVSPPAKPLVFWIENTVPAEYRDAVKEGVLAWNKAFEAIGIKDAIVVKFQPDDADWDAADIRYNTVHWNVSHQLAYGAIAQWIADPRTGEIVTGSFLIESEIARSIRTVRRLFEAENPQKSLEQLRARFERKPPENGAHAVCHYPDFLMDQMAWGLTVMMAREGAGNVTPEKTDELVRQYLVHIAAHEMGHVLGFRHNFEGSAMLPLEDLHDPAVTLEKGMVSSIMDYSPINIAPEGVQQGQYYSTVVGPYDHFAVEYAYADIKPATGETEADVLNRIAEKGETQLYAYGTDEDLYGPGIDPLINQGDLGRDPLEFAKMRAQLAMDTLPKLPNLVDEGEDYALVRGGFNRLLSEYFGAAEYALKFLGGQYFTRVKKGGEHDPLPLDPVPAARQREALNFLLETILSDGLFEVGPDVLNMLAGQKWLAWGHPWPGPSHEYSVINQVTNLYDLVLYAVHSPLIAQRVLDAEKRVPDREVVFDLPELFETVNDGVWREITFNDARSFPPPRLQPWGPYTNKNPYISAYRRILQRQHLKRMIEIMLEPPFGMPEDARTLAWRNLRELDQRMEMFLRMVDQSNGMRVDDYTLNHLMESHEKIKRALDARLSASVDFW